MKYDNIEYVRYDNYNLLMLYNKNKLIEIIVNTITKTEEDRKRAEIDFDLISDDFFLSEKNYKLLEDAVAMYSRKEFEKLVKNNLGLIGEEE